MRAVRSTVKYLLIGLLLLVVLYPQVWLILGSFKTQNEFFTRPTWSLPQHFSLDNYVTALTTSNVGQMYLNSITVTLPSLAAMLLVGIAAGYALEVMVWKGRGSNLLYFVAGLMVPGQMILVPLFTVYFKVGLTNTLWPLVITYVVMGLPLTVFLMATYFRAIPRELFEAATMDGVSMLRAFFVIGLPLMKNAIITIAMVEFFSVWNDLLIALTFTTRKNLQTLQVGLLGFSNEYGSTQYGPLFAAISINVVIVAIVYVFLNKQIMAGLAAGSVKG
jgi:raffinose/stachyose/melibiose transport system permease protein